VWPERERGTPSTSTAAPIGLLPSFRRVRTDPAASGSSNTMVDHMATVAKMSSAIGTQKRISPALSRRRNIGVMLSVTNACTTFSGPITVLAPRRLPAEAGPRACAVTTVTTTEAPETATAPIVVEFPTAWRSLSSRRPWAKLGLIRSRMMATRKPQLPRRARFRAPVDHRPVRAPGPVRRQSRPIRCRRPGRPKLAPRPRPRIEACPANIRAAWRAPRSIDGALSASRTARTPTVMATRGVRSNRAPNVARACSRAASPVFGKAQLRPEIGARQGDNKEENGVGNSERAKCRRLTGSGPP
jgi:hypothetical protein